MHEILINYEPVNPTTWAYLVVAVDDRAVLQIQSHLQYAQLGSGGADLARAGAADGAIRSATSGQPAVEHAGYIWLFAVSGLFMLRLLLDAVMVRRPLLEPNLTVGGLTFLGVSLFVFLMANVITGQPDAADVAGSERAADLRSASRRKASSTVCERMGPVSR